MKDEEQYRWKDRELMVNTVEKVYRYLSALADEYDVNFDKLSKVFFDTFFKEEK